MEPIAVSVREAAELVGCSATHLYELIHAGEFPSVRLGVGRVVVPLEPMREFLNSQARASVGLPQNADGARVQPGPDQDQSTGQFVDSQRAS